MVHHHMSRHTISEINIDSYHLAQVLQYYLIFGLEQCELDSYRPVLEAVKWRRIHLWQEVHGSIFLNPDEFLILDAPVNEPVADVVLAILALLDRQLSDLRPTVWVDHVSGDAVVDVLIDDLASVALNHLSDIISLLLRISSTINTKHSALTISVSCTKHRALQGKRLSGLQQFGLLNIGCRPVLSFILQLLIQETVSHPIISHEVGRARIIRSRHSLQDRFIRPVTHQMRGHTQVELPIKEASTCIQYFHQLVHLILTNDLVTAHHTARHEK